MVPAPEDPFATGEEALDAALEKARDDLEKLEVLNARIPAAALSAQISRMEKAGAAILQQVREHPEKAGISASSSPIICPRPLRY